MAPVEDRAAASVAEIDVEVIYCAGRGQLDHRALRLPAGSVLSDALSASGVLARWPELATGCRAESAEGRPGVGVWGKLASLDRLLQQGDRVEVYRPLLIEPKDARRLRHRHQRLTKSARSKLARAGQAKNQQPG